MNRFVLPFLAIALPFLPASAETGEPPQKISTLEVYGTDPCPRSTEGEIVVCARLPESDRYRLPKRFRGKTAEAEPDSWTNRVTLLETVSRVGTPNSCSPVGSGGFTGCTRQFLRQARDERRAMEAEAAETP